MVLKTYGIAQAVALLAALVSILTATPLFAWPLPNIDRIPSRLEMSKPVPAFLSSVEGTSGNDEIEVHMVAGKIKGFVNGAVVLSRPVDDCRSTGFSPEAAFVLRVDGNGGDDTITVDIGSATDCHCEIRGGEGNDKMWVAGCKGGTANGDGGDDAIGIVGKSLDVDGGEGNDVSCFHD